LTIIILGQAYSQIKRLRCCCQYSDMRALIILGRGVFQCTTRHTFTRIRLCVTPRHVFSSALHAIHLHSFASVLRLVTNFSSALHAIHLRSYASALRLVTFFTMHYTPYIYTHTPLRYASCRLFQCTTRHTIARIRLVTFWVHFVGAGLLRPECLNSHFYLFHR
jgi:hypothetical protein